MVKSHSTSISRPVVDCKRVLYLDHEYVKNGLGYTNGEIEDTVTTTNENINTRYLSDEIRKETEINFVGDQNVDTTNQLPNWYMSWNK